MWQGSAVEVQPGQEHTLFTFGLAGCQAVLVYGEHPNGKKTAILTHYPPISKPENVQRLQQLIRQHPELKKDDVKITMLTVVPGEWRKDPKTGKYEQIAKDQPLVNMLSQAVKSELGSSIEERVLPYSEAQEIGKSSAFIIRFPSKKDGEVRYEACGTHYGKLGE